MFARIKKSGRYQYLQIVENRLDNGKISQRVIGTIGRLDRLHTKGYISYCTSFKRFDSDSMNFLLLPCCLSSLSFIISSLLGNL